MKPSYTVLDKCLCCGSTDLIEYLSLPPQHPINNLSHVPNDSQEKFPLVVRLCNNCSHSQQLASVDPEYLFSQYLYVSGTSKTLDKDFEELANLVFGKVWGEVSNTHLSIMDVAGNDGSFLEKFKKMGCKTTCVDPAENLFEACQARGIDLAICDFFPTPSLGDLKFDAITALNVVAHVPDPLTFLEGCKKHLNKNGKIFVQVSQRYMQRNCEFDTVYHEHISFFTDLSMSQLAERAGLHLQEVIIRDIHGTSTLFVLGVEPPAKKLQFETYYQEFALYEAYTAKYNKWKIDSKALVQSYLDQGYKLVGYGAAAKGLNAVNCLEIEPEYVVDDNPLKQNRYLPNSSIQIVSQDKLLEDVNTEKLCVIVLAWNFFDEISKKIKEVVPQAQTIRFFG
jgi:SAM-dependent methyltransferase